MPRKQTMEETIDTVLELLGSSTAHLRQSLMDFRDKDPWEENFEKSTKFLAQAMVEMRKLDKPSVEQESSRGRSEQTKSDKTGA